MFYCINNIIFYFSELQTALSLAEQSKTMLQDELKVFEDNLEKLNRQVAGTENKLSQVTAQKEKLVQWLFC